MNGALAIQAASEIKYQFYLNLFLVIFLQLIYFMARLSFYILWKHQKTRGFLMFLGGIEKEHRHVMG